MHVAFDHVSFSYGVVEVLHDVGFDVPEGRILAVLGENGAGKSTLMNILGGLIRPARGELLIDGAPARFRSPEESIARGIAFIHQELSPVNDLRVYENMFLGRELRRGAFLDRGAMRGAAAEIMRQIGIDIDADSEMGGLDASRKQLAEIARALLCNAKCLIMDEPTTSLAGPEIERLFGIVRRLASQGVTILFISHKLREVKELCDSYVVMNNGRLVASGEMADATTVELSRLIVGRDMAEKNGAPFSAAPGKELLRVDGLSHGRDFSGISFTLHAGEILGFTGLLGDGRSEIFRAVSGDIPDAAGEMSLHGRPFHPADTREALAMGVAYLPGNRKENAVLPDLSIVDNGTLATLRRYCGRLLLLRRKAQRAEFEGDAREFHIKYADAGDPITTLSGGNQQKVILSRWLNARPSVLILDNPTQGVDVGAKQEIHGIIRGIAASGVGVAVLSGEGQEIAALCTRAIVLFHGHIAGELSGGAITEQAIMRLATGGGAA